MQIQQTPAHTNTSAGEAAKSKGTQQVKVPKNGATKPMKKSNSTNEPTPTSAANAPALPDEQEIGYTSRIFVQALFPYRKLDDYRRSLTQGNKEIIVTAPNGLPYGKYPRLLMAYIITTAVKQSAQAKSGQLTTTEARRVHLGHSLNDFLRNLGVPHRGTGGKTGSATRIREQISRLVTSTITVQERGKNFHHIDSLPRISDKVRLWFDPKNPDQASLEDSYIDLTQDFFDIICTAPIPLDMDVLKSLTKPRAMDIYLWLVMKMFWLEQRNLNSHTFTWHEMIHQFSVEEVTTPSQFRDFRKEFNRAVVDINNLWPSETPRVTTDTKLGVTITRQGLAVTQRQEIESAPKGEEESENGSE